MSGWQAFVDNLLIGTGLVKRGAICGVDGGIWATSPELRPTIEEVVKLAKCFVDPREYAQGVQLGGATYTVSTVDERILKLRRSGETILCARSKQAIVVGTCDDSAHPVACLAVVDKLAEYLLEHGL